MHQNAHKRYKKWLVCLSHTRGQIVVTSFAYSAILKQVSKDYYSIQIFWKQDYNQLDALFTLLVIYHLLCKYACSVKYQLFMQHETLKSVQFQEKSIPTARKRSLKIPRGRVASEARAFKGKYEAKVGFPKNLPRDRGVWISGGSVTWVLHVLDNSTTL